MDTRTEIRYALYSEMFASPVRPANTARFVFLDPRSTNFFADRALNLLASWAATLDHAETAQATDGA